MQHFNSKEIKRDAWLQVRLESQLKGLFVAAMKEDRESKNLSEWVLKQCKKGLK
jgi:hypothetical protein